MQHFFEIASDQVRNIAKHRTSRRIRLGDAKVGVNYIDAHRRLVEQSLELRSPAARCGFCAPAHMLQLEQRT